MHKYRFSISFIATTLLYSSLGFFFFYFQHTIIKIVPTPEHSISVSLASFEPPVIVPPLEEEVIEPKLEEPLPPKPIVKKVIPLLPPKIKKKKVLKKIKKRIKKRKTIKKKRHKKIKKRLKKKKVFKHRTHKTTTKKSNPSKDTTTKPKGRFSISQKAKFLNTIRHTIDKNKSYPHLARRRGMQGSVLVSFTLLKNGHIAHLVVKGKKIFQRSAKKAVKKSFPINTKNAPISLPKKIKFTLRYQMR